MDNFLSLGKKSKFGEIDFSKLKSGITKKDLGIEGNAVLSNIFDSIDNSEEGKGNGRLERNELVAFINKVKNLAGNDKLSKREAQNYEINGEKLGKNKEELLVFLSKLANVTKGVASVDETTETVLFEDGHTEQLLANGNKIVTKKQDGKTVTTTVDENENVLEEIIEDETSVTITKNDSKTNKKQEVTKRDKDDNSVVTTNYEEDGETPKTKTKVSENSTLNFKYNKQIQQWIPVSEEINHGENKVERIVYDQQLSYENAYISKYSVMMQDGKVVSKKVGDKTVEYDGNGNTYVVVQPDERDAAKVAEKFGCSKEKLVELNGNRVFFNVGEKIKIPFEVEPDAAELENRLSSEDSVKKFEEEQEIKRKAAEEAKRKALQAAEERRIAEQNAARQREAQYKKMGLINHEGQGEKITGDYYLNGKKQKSEEFTVIGQCIKGRTLAKSKSGKLVVIAHDGVILKSDYVENSEKYETAKKYNEGVKTRKNAEGLAKEFYEIADDNTGMTSMQKMQNFLDTKINAKNVVAFLNAYDNKNIRKGDSSIVDTVISEFADGNMRMKVLTTILNKLCEAAKNAGVSAADIEKARTEFLTSMKKEFGAIRMINPKDMEKALDFLRGAIAAKQTSNVDNMDSKTAIKNFNSSFKEDYDTAQSVYDESKGKDGWSWSARVGDTVCGWFGCNTIEEMETKLGKNAAAVKELANAKTESEFKAKYKKVFGIDFDPQKIAAAEAAQSNYLMAQGIAQGLNVYDSLLGKANSQNLAQLENSVKTSLKMDNGQFEAVKNEVYAGCENDSDKKQAIIQYLQTVKQELSTEYRKLTNGKTLEQMGKDFELVTRSAFGTNDIGKDVAQFTKNMATTEIVTDIAGDIVLTVALSFVPGGVAAGATKIAATTAKWGVRGVKIAKAMKKTAIVFNKVRKLEQGTMWATKARQGSYIAKAGNVASKVIAGSANAAAGTAIYESTATHHTVEEIKEKCLTNGIYGALGSGASELAPKLMQVFKINNTLATELAEEIINAVGSLGVETAKGGQYGTTDAAIDMIAGIIMARLSHVGSGHHGRKAKVDANVQADAPSVNVNESNVKTAKPKQAAPSQDKPKYIVPENETPFEKATRNGNNPSEIAPPRTVKLGDEKFKAVKENLADELNKISLPDDPHLEILQKRIDAIHDRAQRRELQGMLNKKKADFNEFSPHVDKSETSEQVHTEEPNAPRAEASEGVHVNEAEAPKAEASEGVHVDEAEAPKTETSEGVHVDEAEAPKTDASEGVHVDEAEAPKTDAVNSKSVKMTVQEIKAKFGKKVARMYDAVMNSIEKMKTAADFDKISSYISAKFVGYKSVMHQLQDSLVEKAKKLKLSVQEKINNIYNARLKTHRQELDKYVRTPKRKTMQHSDFVNSRPDLFGDNVDYSGSSVWSGYTPKDRHHGAWKMHLYSVSESDWQTMCDVIIPYLKEHDVDWKTYKAASGADCLNGTVQQGKAFTIYPKNNEDMAKIAKDLDYIIRKNKLQTSDSHIVGDNQMGDTGRLFYRYEFNSKKYKDEILDLGNKNDFQSYLNRYDANRGEGRYLADDMTTDDDIWRNFDPSDANAQPASSSTNSADYSTSGTKAKADPVKERAYRRFDKNATPERMPDNGVLNQNSQYVLNPEQMPVLRLLDGTMVDLNSPEIKNKIMNLRDGEYLTLGRNGDIEVSTSPNVSRHHIVIAKENGTVQLKDVSSFGNTKALSQADYELREKNIQKFDRNAAAVELTNNTKIDQNLNYILDINDLPKLRLYDGTVIDLNNPKYYSAIQNLKEGGFITLGRTGFADIGISSSTSISRNHIILTIQDGELLLKDVSANAGTYRVGGKNASGSQRQHNTSDNYNKDNSYKSNESGQAGTSSKISQEQINEYKKLLGIDDSVLTKDAIKKAYRKKSLEWHPDRHPENMEKATEMMKKINEAKDQLDKLVG